jgi:uncharacterized protein
MYDSQKFVQAFIAGYEAVNARQDEINKLNVFPVPDGDTGTNVSLTLQNVVNELRGLPLAKEKAQVFKAIKHGSLMGARGNSGVITSQILRGITEGAAEYDEFSVDALVAALEKARDVAYQAVRKPVEGTILTVIKDTALAARKGAEEGVDLENLLELVSRAAYESVRNTPELLPKLKENGVVDSGGLALAILIEGIVNSLLGKDTGGVSEQSDALMAVGSGGVFIEQINDWEDAQFTYCTEFLYRSDEVNLDEAYAFLALMGDCQLMVGDHPDFKVHVHTDSPGTVLTWMTERGQVHEVYIHNMKLQTAERSAGLAEEATQAALYKKPAKSLGFVAVAAGSGNEAILKSLNVDCVVSGGQTMNPSTKDILDAINSVNAETVIVFPNNKNIIMAANNAAEVSEKPTGVVPTLSVPQSFTALFSADYTRTLDENVAAMREAISFVRNGEVTTAVKDAVADDGRPIHEGDVMGIADDTIQILGNDVMTVSLDLIDVLLSDDADTITLLAGIDLSEDDFEQLQEAIEERFPDIEIDAHRGEQPLYPLVLSVE